MIILIVLISNELIVINGINLKSHIAPIRPPIIDEFHNKDRILFSFDPQCSLSIRTVKHYIQSLLTLYPCLSQTNNGKIYKRNGDYHTYLSLQYENNNINNLNISCIDDLEINWNKFCLYFVDYEYQFQQSFDIDLDTDSEELNCIKNQKVNNFNGQNQKLWHLDYIDGLNDNQYTFIDTSAKYKNIDIFVLDTSIQSSHDEFQGINYFQFDEYFTESTPLTLHGSHVAALAVGKNVGITQGSQGFALYEYPICRIKGGCAFSYIEDALEKIITHITDDTDILNPKRVIINLSVQTKGLPSSTYLNYLESLFKQIIDLNGIIVASAGNRDIDACQSFPGASKYTISVGAYGQNMELYGNTGSCVDLYAPGMYVFYFYFFLFFFIFCIGVCVFVFQFVAFI